MTRWGVVGGLLGIMLWMGLGAGQRPRAPFPEVEVRRLLEEFRRGWLAGDAEALRRTCAPSLILVSLGRRDRGIEEVAEHARVLSQNFPASELQLEHIEVRVTGALARAEAEARYVQKTAHGTALSYTGYAAFWAERQRGGWRLTRVDLNLRPHAASPAEPSGRSSAEGAWLLESARDLATGRPLTPGAFLLFTRSHYALWVVAPDRRPPARKKLAEYSKRELLELVRDVEGSVGEYRLEGNRLHLTPVFSFFPEMTGEPQTFENVEIERDRMRLEWTTRERRILTVWRRRE